MWPRRPQRLSLRARLLWTFLVPLAVVLVLVGVISTLVLRSQLISQVDVQLSAAVARGSGSYGGNPPPPDYDYRPRRPPPPDWDDDRYDRPPPRYDRRVGGICVTARGSCPTGRPLPRTAPCGCEIPGFGYKRGAVQ